MPYIVQVKYRGAWRQWGYAKFWTRAGAQERMKEAHEYRRRYYGRDLPMRVRHVPLGYSEAP